MTQPTRITATDPEAQSADLVAKNISKLKDLFPEAFTEGKIHFDVLKQLLGGAVDEREEKYGLTWHGKRQARQLALTPSLGTLRPCPEESVDWDTTKNLMIEGDNLEVLKLLQKIPAMRPKIIYIDPPYNTGGDFVYPDDFRDNIANYLRITNQTSDSGEKLFANNESSGRFHTNWLNMMHSRLVMARSLMRDDGVIFISISDKEQPRLRMICDEIFGEESFIAQLIWMKGKEGGNDNDGFGMHHDYILCYSKNHDLAVESIKLDEKDTSRHITELPEENLVIPGDIIYKSGEPFQLINLSKQKDYKVKIKLKDRTEIEWDSYCPQKTIDEYIRIGKVFVGSRRVPYIKSFLSDESQGSKPSTIIESEFGTTKAGGIAIRELFGDGKIFSYPKPPSLICRLIQMIKADEGNDPCVVLDFFAGSGTTAHSVMSLNAVDGKNRRFVLVQFPEPLNPQEKEQKIASDYCDIIQKPRIISELTKERLRRAAAKIKTEYPGFTGDLGFRVFKLDASNIATWEPQRDDLATSIQEHIDHLKPGRTQEDLLFEILLKYGLDLASPITTATVGGFLVHRLGGGVLTVCLSDGITAERAEVLGQGLLADLAAQGVDLADARLVFKDHGFADDAAKTNLMAILTQGGIQADHLRTL